MTPAELQRYHYNEWIRQQAMADASGYAIQQAIELAKSRYYTNGPLVTAQQLAGPQVGGSTFGPQSSFTGNIKALHLYLNSPSYIPSVLHSYPGTTVDRIREETGCTHDLCLTRDVAYAATTITHDHNVSQQITDTALAGSLSLYTIALEWLRAICPDAGCVDDPEWELYCRVPTDGHQEE